MRGIRFYLYTHQRLLVNLDIDCIHVNRIRLNIHQYVHHFLIIEREVLSSCRIHPVGNAVTMSERKREIV